MSEYQMNLKLSDYKCFFITLGIGVFLTFFAYQIESHHRYLYETERFNQLVKQKFVAIENKLDDSFLVLNTLNSFFESSASVERDEFKAFTRILLQKHSEIKALAWIPIITLGARGDYEQSTDHTLISSETRTRYFPIYFIEPLEGNERVLGYDLGSSAAWLKALEQAPAHNSVFVTQPIAFVPEQEHQHLIFAFHPFYAHSARLNSYQHASAISGYALMVLNLDDLYRNAIVSSYDEQSIHIAVKDKLTQRWLAGDPLIKAQGTDYHYLESELNIGGRQWLLSAAAPYDFLGKSSRLDINDVLLLGTLTSLVLAIYIQALKHKYDCIDQRVKAQTQQLLTTEVCYKSVLDTARDAIINIDEAGIVSHFNHGAERLFGYDPEDVIGRNVSMLMGGQDAYNHDRYIANYLKAGIEKVIGDSREVFARHKDGRLIPVHLAISDTGLAGDMRFTTIIRDLSDLKEAEKKICQHQYHLRRAVQERTAFLKQENSNLKKLSEIDPLTMIANRRVYGESLLKEIAAAKRTKKPLALMMIDVDFFKNYNDNYGHDAGDIALQRVAKAIAAALPRQTDLVARFGGEEFVVLMPATSSQGAYFVAEHIRKNIKALAIKHQYSEAADVITVSIGLSALQGVALNETDLFSRADSALYIAKERGRDQCIDYKKAQKIRAFKCVN